MIPLTLLPISILAAIAIILGMYLHFSEHRGR